MTLKLTNTLRLLGILFTLLMPPTAHADAEAPPQFPVYPKHPCTQARTTGMDACAATRKTEDGICHSTFNCNESSLDTCWGFRQDCFEDAVQAQSDCSEQVNADYNICEHAQITKEQTMRGFLIRKFSQSQPTPEPQFIKPLHFNRN